MDASNFISGIYHYCDRWCDRCAFTNRCRVFHHEQNNGGEPEQNGAENEEDGRLQHSLQEALDLLQYLLEKIELPDHPDFSSEDSEEPAPSSNEWYERYALRVDEFFDRNSDFFREQEQHLEELVDMGMPVDVERLGFLHEALFTIRWHQHFIGAKISRAVNDHAAGAGDGIQSDGNGSAKVAMISLQKSTDAWHYLAQMFKDKQEEVDYIILVLNKTRQRLAWYYPDWAGFHRPGFDDEPHTVVRLDFNPN